MKRSRLLAIVGAVLIAAAIAFSLWPQETRTAGGPVREAPAVAIAPIAGPTPIHAPREREDPDASSAKGHVAVFGRRTLQTDVDIGEVRLEPGVEAAPSTASLGYGLKVEAGRAILTGVRPARPPSARA